eukprot:5643341-Pyramimonas_sp.AAC.1
MVAQALEQPRAVIFDSKCTAEEADYWIYLILLPNSGGRRELGRPCVCTPHGGRAPGARQMGNVGPQAAVPPPAREGSRALGGLGGAVRRRARSHLGPSEGAAVGPDMD